MMRTVTKILLALLILAGCREQTQPIQILSPTSMAQVTSTTFRVEIRGSISPSQLILLYNGQPLTSTEYTLRSVGSHSLIQGTPRSSRLVGGQNRLTVSLRTTAKTWSQTVSFLRQGGTPSPSTPIDFRRLSRDMQTRKTAYLQQLARGTDLHAQIARLQLRQKPLSQPILDACNKVDKRKDTSDFTMATLIRLAHLHGNDPLLPTSVQVRLENSIRNFRYWLDEPGRDNMIMWSEKPRTSSQSIFL